MGNCQTCAHGRYNTLWGDWKCGLSGLYCYDVRKNDECPDYKKGTPGDSKDDVREEEE